MEPREEAISELKVLQASDDPEEDHRKADDVLCDLLSSLGYSDVVVEYYKVMRWFS